MRVLFWSGSFGPHIGGVEVLAAKLLPALRERGYEFAVLSSQNNTEFSAEGQFKGIPIYRFPFWKARNNAAQIMQIRQQIINLKRTFVPDLIHLNAIDTSTFFHLITAPAYAAPLLVTLHGEWPSQVNAAVAQTLRSADWVTGCSAAILRRGWQLVPELISRSSVIPNAIEEPSLLPGPLPVRAPQLLCLGRLVFVKGFDVALTAFASLKDAFPEARLIIAGDGAARADLERQTVKLGLTDVVKFIGWVAPDQVPALMNAVTIVIVPSRGIEGFGLVALEAAYMARPVVASDVGGIPEVVVHKQTGLLVEKENPEALAEAITFLLKQPWTAADLGRAARRRAQEIFNFVRYVDAYDVLYQKLFSREGRAGRTA